MLNDSFAMRLVLRLLPVLSVLAVALATSASAQEEQASLPTEEASIDGVPLGFYDDAFERFMSLRQVGAAWQQLDHATLTDCSLQLVEAEQVLHRTHLAGLKAARLIELTAKVAAREGDEEALTRLEQGARSLDNQELVAKLAAAKQLAGQSRSGPGSPLDLTEEEQQSFAAFLAAVQRAIIGGNAATMNQLLANPPNGFPEEKLAVLKKATGGARSAEEAEEAVADVELLEKLSEGSRGDGFYVTPTKTSSGTNWKCNLAVRFQRGLASGNFNLGPIYVRKTPVPVVKVYYTGGFKFTFNFEATSTGMKVDGGIYLGTIRIMRSVKYF